MYINLKKVFYLVLIFFVVGVSCKSLHNSQDRDNRPAIVTFPDSIQASKLIVGEDIEGFFSEVRPLERQIQLKETDKEISIEEFKEYLSTQVSNWTIEEKTALFEMVENVKKLCDTLSPRLFPADLRLIKIKTNHYGPDVYYTKGKNIYIPENIFKNFSKTIHFPILVHELFHIISRYDPELRHDLYGYIGYKIADKPVELNSFLNERKLTNPDAVSHHYYINLTYEGKDYKSIPMISSRWGQYKDSHKSFFDYLSFDMYELLEVGENYVAVTHEDGQTTLPSGAMESLFEQIKDNTQYIIHPEEIIADNFMLALIAYSKGDYSKFSPKGKELIDRIIMRLKQL